MSAIFLVRIFLGLWRSTRYSVQLFDPIGNKETGRLNTEIVRKVEPEYMSVKDFTGLRKEVLSGNGHSEKSW